MCLLIVLADAHPEFPLVVAANRDEMLERPAIPMTVLRSSDPRVIGGRDELAGGTWLAVNEAGVVAALTNRPRAGGRDETKRSRGELPLALAKHVSAEAAVDAFADRFNPAEYNAAWLIVADSKAAFSVDMTGDTVITERLPAGVHILENRPLGAPSPKVDHVRSLVAGVTGLQGDAAVRRLQAVLADHHVPDVPSAADDAGREVPPAVRAACVHGERYGTRWSGVVTVAQGDDRPAVRYTDGPPCTVPWSVANW